MLYAKGLHYLDKFIRWICATYQFQCVTYPAIHCTSWANDTLQSYGKVLLNILAKQFQCLMNSVTSIFNCTLGLIHLQTPVILYLKKNVPQGIQNIHKIISYKDILKALYVGKNAKIQKPLVTCISILKHQKYLWKCFFWR